MSAEELAALGDNSLVHERSKDIVYAVRPGSMVGDTVLLWYYNSLNQKASILRNKAELASDDWVLIPPAFAAPSPIDLMEVRL